MNYRETLWEMSVDLENLGTQLECNELNQIALELEDVIIDLDEHLHKREKE